MSSEELSSLSIERREGNPTLSGEIIGGGDEHEDMDQTATRTKRLVPTCITLRLRARKRRRAKTKRRERNQICDAHAEAGEDSSLLSASSASDSALLEHGNDTDETSHNVHASNGHDREALEQMWRKLSDKWGMDVVREVIYARPNNDNGDDHRDSNSKDQTFFDTRKRWTVDDPALFLSTSSPSASSRGGVKKIHERFVIARVHDDEDNNACRVLSVKSAGGNNSKSDVTKLKSGDVITAIYGVKNPSARLIFGTMRDSNQFEITVKRMETEQEKLERLFGLPRDTNEDFSSFQSDCCSVSKEQPIERSSCAEEITKKNGDEIMKQIMEVDTVGEDDSRVAVDGEQQLGGSLVNLTRSHLADSMHALSPSREEVLEEKLNGERKEQTSGNGEDESLLYQWVPRGKPRWNATSSFAGDCDFSEQHSANREALEHDDGEALLRSVPVAERYLMNVTKLAGNEASSNGTNLRTETVACDRNDGVDKEKISSSNVEARNPGIRGDSTNDGVLLDMDTRNYEKAATDSDMSISDADENGMEEEREMPFARHDEPGVSVGSAANRNGNDEQFSELNCSAKVLDGRKTSKVSPGAIQHSQSSDFSSGRVFIEHVDDRRDETLLSPDKTTKTSSGDVAKADHGNFNETWELPHFSSTDPQGIKTMLESLDPSLTRLNVRRIGKKSQWKINAAKPKVYFASGVFRILEEFELGDKKRFRGRDILDCFDISNKKLKTDKQAKYLKKGALRELEKNIQRIQAERKEESDLFRAATPHLEKKKGKAKHCSDETCSVSSVLGCSDNSQKDTLVSFDCVTNDDSSIHSSITSLLIEQVQPVQTSNVHASNFLDAVADKDSAAICTVQRHGVDQAVGTMSEDVISEHSTSSATTANNQASGLMVPQTCIERSHSQSSADANYDLKSAAMDVPPEIVKAVPPATMKHAVLAPGSRITSTSSVAGLSYVKSLKMRRLWPDSSIFCKKVLKWCPPAVVKQKDNSVRFHGPILPGGSSRRNPLDSDCRRDPSHRSSPTSNISSRASGGTDIPDTYRDAAEMVRILSPYILEEGRAAVNREYQENSDNASFWTRETMVVSLRSCNPVGPKTQARMYELGFHVDSSRNDTSPPLNLGELFALYSDSWKETKCCLGIIGSNDINSIYLQDQKCSNDDRSLFRLWVCAVDDQRNHGTGWLAESDLPPKDPDGTTESQTFHVMNIGTATNIMREFEGIKSMAAVKDHLRRVVFTGKLTGVDADAKTGFALGEEESNRFLSESCLKGRGQGCDSGTPQVNKPPSVPMEVWSYINATLNPFQASTVEKIMRGKSRENFALIQGPPGTGKTSAVIGVVSALLNGICPQPGGKLPGTKITVGKTFSGGGTNGDNSSGRVSSRILACAPSNSAVDELAWRIHNFALGPGGQIGDLNVIRFGLLPGEDRHDGRGMNGKPGSNVLRSETEREKYLRGINLDLLVGTKQQEREGQTSDAETASARKAKGINYSHERRKILSRCHVVCTTLSSAGSKAFIESVSRDEFPSSEFDAVIIDEACQASEQSCLIPLKYNPKLVVLVGDPKQLPVFVLTQAAGKFNQSLFQRLQDNGWPVDLLPIQYRMHKEIEKFPSEQFYGGQLFTSTLVLGREPAEWHSLCFPPYVIWNVRHGSMSRGTRGSIFNKAEVNFITELLSTFGNIFRGTIPISIGIIAFYSEQVSRLKNAISSLPIARSRTVSIKISTVDSFQGSERDIIILSCVRSSSSRGSSTSDIGFLQDYRRVNVALTRARQSMWIVGDCEVLSTDPLWSSIILDAGRRNLIASSGVLRKLCGGQRVGCTEVADFRHSSRSNIKKGKRHVQRHAKKTKITKP